MKKIITTLVALAMVLSLCTINSYAESSSGKSMDDPVEASMGVPYNWTWEGNTDPHYYRFSTTKRGVTFPSGP